jgi:O-acetyl-ADP-ribose deacetylase (regulator of RNase III)
MKFVKGNLLYLAEQGHFDVIVHGCNCLCVMGAGIALAIANRYPSVYEADMQTKRGDYNKLGNYTYARVLTKTNPASVFTVVNAYTQYTCSDGDPNKDMFEYEAFTLILKKLRKQFGSVRYGFPLIGCGLARGNKERILKLIEDFDVDDMVTVVELG